MVRRAREGKSENLYIYTFSIENDLTMVATSCRSGYSDEELENIQIISKITLLA